MERKIQFRKNWYIFWGFGEHRLNTFRELRIFPGEFGEISALFLGGKGAQTPWGASRNRDSQTATKLGVMLHILQRDFLVEYRGYLVAGYLWYKEWHPKHARIQRGRRGKPTKT